MGPAAVSIGYCNPKAASEPFYAGLLAKSRPVYTLLFVKSLTPVFGGGEACTVWCYRVCVYLLRDEQHLLCKNGPSELLFLAQFLNLSAMNPKCRDLAQPSDLFNINDDNCKNRFSCKYSTTRCCETNEKRVQHKQATNQIFKHPLSPSHNCFFFLFFSFELSSDWTYQEWSILKRQISEWTRPEDLITWSFSGPRSFKTKRNNLRVKANKCPGTGPDHYVGTVQIQLARPPASEFISCFISWSKEARQKWLKW